jgi:hypothetical protein
VLEYGWASPPKRNDVLLTVDGGTSIGKPVLFDLDEEFAIDSHVAILRPSGIEPIALVLLLASPLGQIQFQQAESGASGQTGVTEEDVRRFRFPHIDREDMRQAVDVLRDALASIANTSEELVKREELAWRKFQQEIADKSSGASV